MNPVGRREGEQVSAAFVFDVLNHVDATGVRDGCQLQRCGNVLGEKPIGIGFHRVLHLAVLIQAEENPVHLVEVGCGFSIGRLCDAVIQARAPAFITLPIGRKPPCRICGVAKPIGQCQFQGGRFGPANNGIGPDLNLVQRKGAALKTGAARDDVRVAADARGPCVGEGIVVAGHGLVEAPRIARGCVAAPLHHDAALGEGRSAQPVHEPGMGRSNGHAQPG